MQICAVHTKIKDEYENQKNYYTDLCSIFAYLSTSQAVRYVIINRDNSFDRLCEEVVEDTEDLRLNEIKIINSSKLIPLEKMLELQSFQRSAVTGNFVICDKSTKDFVREKISVDHFIEMPYSELCIACSVPLY